MSQVIKAAKILIVMSAIITISWRSFSALKKLKPCLRSTTKDSRISTLMGNTCLIDVVNEFAERVYSRKQIERSFGNCSLIRNHRN